MPHALRKDDGLDYGGQRGEASKSAAQKKPEEEIQKQKS